MLGDHGIACTSHKRKGYFCTQNVIFLILFPKDELLKIFIRVSTSVIANHLSNQQSRISLVFQCGVGLKLLVLKPILTPMPAGILRLHVVCANTQRTSNCFSPN